MRHSSSFAILGVAGALAFGCGDDDGPGGAGGGPSTSSTTATGSTTGTATTSSTTTATTTTTGMGGGMASAIVPNITDESLFGNCEPIVPADPVGGSFDVTYDNTGSTPGELTITNVRMELTGIDSTLVWNFDVMPAGSGTVAAMGSSSVVHMKVVDSGTGNGEMPCGYCGAAGELIVGFSDGMGGTATDSFPIGAFECAF